MYTCLLTNVYCKLLQIYIIKELLTPKLIIELIIELSTISLKLANKQKNKMKIAIQQLFINIRPHSKLCKAEQCMARRVAH